MRRFFLTTEIDGRLKENLSEFLLAGPGVIANQKHSVQNIFNTAGEILPRWIQLKNYAMKKLRF